MGVKKEFPTEILLGDGTTLTVENSPSLKKFFDDTVIVASQREKDKLYPSIVAKDNELKQLKEQVTQNDSEMQTLMTNMQRSMAENSELRAQLKQFDSATSQQFLDERGVKTIEEVIERKFAEMMPQLMQTEIAPVRETLNKFKENALETYKQRRLQEEAGKLMPELVNGSNEAEIETSIAFAKELFAKYGVPQPQEQASQTPTGSQQQQQQQPVKQQEKIVVPNVPLYNNPASSDLPDIGKMSTEEFGANRNDLLAKLKASFPENQ